MRLTITWSDGRREERRVASGSTVCLWPDRPAYIDGRDEPREQFPLRDEHATGWVLIKSYVTECPALRLEPGDEQSDTRDELTMELDLEGPDTAACYWCGDECRCDHYDEECRWP